MCQRCVERPVEISTLNRLGYQLLAEVEGMPAAYQHIRVRFRVEQTRLLNWGEKVGLVEELLDHPSKTLQLDRNLVFDILLEIQALFKDCVKITDKYDHKVPLGQDPAQVEAPFDRRFPRGTNAVLTKILNVVEKTPQVGGRLKWAMVKQEAFKATLEKLIGYNDAIEGLLDRTSIGQLHEMQHQTYMVMLQLNSKVDELKQMSMAIQVKTQPLDRQTPNGLSRASTLVAGQDDENASLAGLVDFKARQRQVEQEGSSVNLQPIRADAVVLKSSDSTRSEAVYFGKSVWIEWKAYVPDNHFPPSWDRMIEDRVKQLAKLLGSPGKPKEFRAPQCLGYIEEKSEEKRSFGFVYEKPGDVAPTTKPVSLLELIKTTKMPSLTKRRALAQAISQSLMYLHSVNWLHKGIRSNNVVFFGQPGNEVTLAEPVLSGFEYARPDLTGEMTEPTPRYSENDVYKHPHTLSIARPRSKKSDDVYSMGVVLIEIAHWRSIADIVSLPKDTKAARAMVKKVRGILIEREFLEGIEGIAGELYQEAVRKCLTGGEELGLSKNADETDPEVGAAIHETYSKEIVGRISDMRV